MYFEVTAELTYSNVKVFCCTLQGENCNTYVKSSSKTADRATSGPIPYILVRYVMTAYICTCAPAVLQYVDWHKTSPTDIPIHAYTLLKTFKGSLSKPYI